MNEQCYDCGSDAEVVELHAYGVDQPETYCRVCYISNNFYSTDVIPVTYRSEPFLVMAVPEWAELPVDIHPHFR
jgi:hypothetical protein